MQEQKNIIDCYNKTATQYADKFLDELTGKHFDRLILEAFEKENISAGKCIDLGCGPGQTTKYLFDAGLTNIIGTDLSTAMIDAAKRLNPKIQFETADILQLKYADASFASAVAFYAIVHFDYEQLKTAFSEIRRVLIDKGQFLFSFHIGNEIVHHDNFLGEKVSIDFHFFETAKVIDILKATGFVIIDAIERAPYAEAEYPSKRAYIWVKKN